MVIDKNMVEITFNRETNKLICAKVVQDVERK